MHKRAASATRLVYSDGFAIKIAVHAALLSVVVWAVLVLPSGGVLTFSDHQAHLYYENPLGIAIDYRVMQVHNISDVTVSRARHRPGGGPPTLSSRVEIHLADGELVPLTRHYSNRRGEMAAIERQINGHLQGPSGELTVAYNDHKPALAIGSLLGLYAAYAILWGIRQTTFRIDRDRGRISVSERRLIARREESWSLSQVAYVTLQTKGPDEKRPKVRPALVLQNRDVKPIVREYSSVSGDQYRGMLTDVATFSGIAFR